MTGMGKGCIFSIVGIQGEKIRMEVLFPLPEKTDFNPDQLRQYALNMLQLPGFPPRKHTW